MAENNRTGWVGTDARKWLVEQEYGLVEEVKMLRQHMADMYQAWITAKAPPPPPTSFLNATLTQTPVIVPNDPPYSPDSPAYHGFPNHPSSSITHLPITFPKNCPPIFSTIPNDEHPLKAHNAQYYPSEVAHKVPNTCKQSLHDKLHVENERFTGREGKDGIPRKLKGIEQSLKNKQGREDQGSMTYKELSVSPNVRPPVGFKVPIFNLYDGCGDPIDHLRVYCSEMRSVGEKDDLLMAYFSTSLTGAALDWYIHQDVGKWPTLGEMAQDFVQHFQYKSGITPDRSSLSKMEKKSEESFREFGLRWREQVVRVNTPIDEEEMVELFL
ncbi:uncharacterized protein [Nicotiana sylvestris]|uniref:uncharacterized protein n=1 Tax=Nicotiana sylvestris TaxID=4096 RepID=UPI00388C9B62